ncbi:MAG: neutral zinc metallopeptidase [Thermomicrobiales bacterium]|nr:neutral zinc metallopeptidase [Thermomicrobiales bacterium]
MSRGFRNGLVVFLVASMLPALATAEQRGRGQTEDTGPSYEDVLTLAIGDDGEPGGIDTFWRNLFEHLEGAPAYESPGAFLPFSAGSLPESECIGSVADAERQLNNAFYCPVDAVLAWDDDWLRELQAARSFDFAPLAVIAHEWGHHVQALLGSRGTGLGAELQADCYAALYLDDAVRSRDLSYEGFATSVTSLFSMGNLYYSNSTWFNAGEHGSPALRTMAAWTADATSFLNELRQGAGQQWNADLSYCEDYEHFEPAPAVRIGPFAINPLPGSSVQVIDGESVEVSHPVAATRVEFRLNPMLGTSAYFFAAVRDDYLTSNPDVETRQLNEPHTYPLLAGRETTVQTYEQIAHGRQQSVRHGLFALDVLPGVGSILIDIYRDGPASENVGDWETLHAHLVAVTTAMCSPGGLDIGACSFSTLGGLGLPELTVRATHESIDPDRWMVEPGPTLVTFVNEAEIAFAYYGEPAPVAQAFFLAKLSDTLDLSAASPAQVPPDGGLSVRPEWFYDAIMLGTANPLDPLSQSQVVVDLTPGSWVVVGYPFISPISNEITVREAATSASIDDVPFDAEIVHGEDGVTGLDSVKPGHQIWRISNLDDEPHDMHIYRFPNGTTTEQALEVYEYWFAPEGAAPPDDLGFHPDEDVEVVAPFVTVMSSGQSVLIEVQNLEPGVYGVLCYVPVQGVRKAHSADGEFTLFTVGGILGRMPVSQRSGEES